MAIQDLHFYKAKLANSLLQWQFVCSALTFVKTGYCLFHTITKDLKATPAGPRAASVETHNERTTALVQIFSSKIQEFIEVLDCLLHKKPTTTDWVAIVTSVALIFDMFQYLFYLLQVSSSFQS